MPSTCTNNQPVDLIEGPLLILADLGLDQSGDLHLETVDGLIGMGQVQPNWAGS